MANLKTRKGLLYYKPHTIYLGINQINPDIALKNLKDLAAIFKKHKIPLTPCFGTLLGIIRDNNFIVWDEDIDLVVLSEDLDKLLDAFWDLRELGFKVIRQDRCYHLFSVIRNGEYIDFYIMDKISPELRTNLGGTFLFEKHLTSLIKYDFKGIEVMIPKEYDEYLTFLYGDWRTPIRYVSPTLSKNVKLKRKIIQKFKQLLPSKCKLWMLKKYHKKDLITFLRKCKEKHIILSYPINM